MYYLLYSSNSKTIIFDTQCLHDICFSILFHKWRKSVLERHINLLLWIVRLYPRKIHYVKAPNPKVTVFSHRDFIEVIKIKWGHKNGVGLASVSMGCQALHGGSALYANLVLVDVLALCGGQGPWGDSTPFGGPWASSLGWLFSERTADSVRAGASNLWVLCKQGVWWDGMVPRDNLFQWPISLGCPLEV